MHRSVVSKGPRAVVLGVGLGVALAASACVDTDAAVFVEASIGAASLTVSGSSLVTTLDGTFQLGLHLGPRASGPSSVSIGKFSLTNADQSLTLVDPLDIATTASFPVTVDPDSDVTVDFVVATADAPADALTAICGADGLRIAGAIEDSLQDGATPVASNIFYPTCP